jgi:hypothetical protein
MDEIEMLMRKMIEYNKAGDSGIGTKAGDYLAGTK